MMIVNSVKKVYRIYRDSFKSARLLLLLLAIACYFLSKRFIDDSSIYNVYVDVLNGFGVMTAFFILALDKIDIGKIREKANYRVKIGRKDEILMSHKLINTIFSLMISMFSLLGLMYILLIFNVQSLLLLVILCFFIFGGFLFLLSIWHWLDSKA